MRPNTLILRCFAEKIGDQWQAFCLDFDLAVQGNSFRDVRKRLDAMIRDYVRDALVGEDRDYADQLLRRRAPLSLWLRYYRIYALVHLGRLRDGFRKTYNTSMPLQPQT